jgi:hypothetical protein
MSSLKNDWSAYRESSAPRTCAERSPVVSQRKCDARLGEGARLAIHHGIRAIQTGTFKNAFRILNRYACHAQIFERPKICLTTNDGINPRRSHSRSTDQMADNLLRSGSACSERSLFGRQCRTHGSRTGRRGRVLMAAISAFAQYTILLTIRDSRVDIDYGSQFHRTRTVHFRDVLQSPNKLP